MLGRSSNLYLVVALLVALFAGCKKSEPGQKPGGESPQPQGQPYTNSAPGELIARIHWLGKKHLAGDVSAAYFMGIWNMPESQKLETQTLDKLALAPWDLPRSGTNLSAIIATNAGSALLRPLLDDLVQQECYLEIRQSTNQPVQGVFAIRLDDQRAALWQTNITNLTQSLITNRQSQVTSHASLFTNLTVSRTGQWVLLGSGADPLLADITARIQHNNAPLPPSLTNYWLDAQLDLKRLSTTPFHPLHSALGPNIPTNITFTFIGNGQNVHTRADLDFPQSLPFELEPWNIPTNLIHDPIIGFSAIRGFRPFLKSFKPWNDLQLGTPPNQAFGWSQHGVPWLHFVAVPSAEASNQVDRLSDYVVANVNPKMEAGRIGEFQKVPGTQRLKWRGVPVFSPDLNWTTSDGNSYIVGGFFARSLTNQPPPPELFSQFVSDTNMLWYDWEFSPECLRGWAPISQVVRHMFNLPRLEGDPDINWLMAVAGRARNCVSALNLESPTHLSFTRQSTIGFTAAELPLLLDWLESPKFPRGLHTFLAPPPPPPTPPTNAVPQQPPPQPTNGLSEPKKP
jgi:hypothetical protein